MTPKDNQTISTFNLASCVASYDNDMALMHPNRSKSPLSTRRFLHELERSHQDKPLTVFQDLQTLKEAGLTNAAVFWLEYREAVIGGRKD